MTRRFLIVLLVLVSACTRTPTSTTTPGSITTTTPVPGTSPTSTTAITTTTEPAPTGIEVLPAELQSQLVELVEQTERLRNLRFESAPVVSAVSEAELERRVRQDFFDDPQQVATDQALYVLLGLLPEGTDLETLLLDLFGEQVAGFYDGETGELVVSAESDRFTPYERSTVVHELTHALTDQVYDVWPRFEAMVDEQRYDEAAAFQAVLEGDATLTQGLYLGTLDAEELAQVFDELDSVDTTVLDSVPRFIRDSLQFPYDQGLRFVQGLYDQGGFQAVESAYLDPPKSTEQIRRPKRWPTDEPRPVEHPVLEVPGYEQVYDSVWGELGFALMFDQVLGGREDAVAGWGGDRYQVWFDGSNVALALTYRGDTSDDAGELAAALVDYAEAAMRVGRLTSVEGATVGTGENYVWIRRVGDQVGWIAATDPRVGEALAAAYAAG